MNALGFIKESIESKQKELLKLHGDVGIYAHTDNYSVYLDYSDGYGNSGYSDDWGDYTVSSND